MFPYCEICERPIHDEWWAQSKFGNKRHVGCDQKVMVAESGDEPSDDLTRSVFIELVDDAFDKHVADDILEWHPQAVSCVTYMAEALADALGLADDDTGTDSPTADGGRESEPVGVGTRLPRPAGDLPTVGCDAPGCTNAAKHLWAPGDGTETYLCDAHAGPDGPANDVGADAPTPDSIDHQAKRASEWKERSNLHAALASAYKDQLARIQEAVYSALQELGVPGEGYPAPVANAVRILTEALDG